MQDKDYAYEQAAAQVASIVEMVAALNCDYDRLEELREAVADAAADGGTAAWAAANPDDAEELAELESAAGECEDGDQARMRIHEDALSVEVRSDWHEAGETAEDAEFCILLCTGGPAVRIVGDLDRGTPSRPRVQYQDWSTPWTEYIVTGADADAVQTYCEQFYFGE